MPPPRPVAPAVLAAWTLLVWTTRIGNIWNDTALSTGEKWGRTGLAVSFTILALGVAVAWWRRLGAQRIVVVALAGWTIAVWVARSARIATGGHSAAFVAVHLVLALVSCVLAVRAVRAPAPAREPRVAA